MRRTRLSLGFLTACLALSVGSLPGHPAAAWSAEGRLAAEIKGFSGQVRGLVMSTKDDRQILLTVTRVVEVDKASKASRPHSLKDHVIRVIIRSRRRNLAPDEDKIRTAFVKSLQPQQEITIAIRSGRRRSFFLVDVPESFREKAGAAKNDAKAQSDLLTVTGILNRKGDDWVEIQAEGHNGGTRFHAANDEVRKIFRDLIVTNLVTVRYRAGERRETEHLEVIRPRDKAGTFIGRIVAKSGNAIDVKSNDGGPVERYIPRWFGGMPKDGGGPEKSVVRALAPLRVGDHVQIKWIYDERKRLITVHKHGPADTAAATPVAAPHKPAVKPASHPRPPASEVDPAQLAEELERALR